MIEVVYVPVGANSGQYMDYLENKLNNGYNVIRADSCNDAIMYIIEKKDNKLSSEELNYRVEQKAIQTEMLKEIIRRDNLLRSYKDRIEFLICDKPDQLLPANILKNHFQKLNSDVEELLGKEIWMDNKEVSYGEYRINKTKETI